MGEELKTETGSGSLERSVMRWRDIGDGGVRAEHDQGDWTGAVVTTAQVVQGGNGRWTPCLFQYSKGRPKKRGAGRIAGKCVSNYYPGQVDNREQAMAMIEKEWAKVVSHNEKVSDRPR